MDRFRLGLSKLRLQLTPDFLPSRCPIVAGFVRVIDYILSNDGNSANTVKHDISIPENHTQRQSLTTNP